MTDKIAYLKDKLQGWPDAMCLTSKDIADLLALIADYQVALPLLEAVKASHPEDIARNLTATSNYCARIVVEANGYVNRTYRGKEPTQ